MKRIVILIAYICMLLVSGCMLLTSCTAGKTSADILVEIRPEINYVTHLYTLAGLGFEDEEYVSKYGETLPSSAIDTLHKYSDLLTFGQGEGGMLAFPFFFAVSDANLATADDMKAVFDIQAEAGKQQGVPEEAMQSFWNIAKVFMDNYPDYLANVYPRVKADLEGHVESVRTLLKGNTIVADWERVTGYKWDKGDYHWLLYRAGSNGPSYNNLDPVTNTVYYKQDPQYQVSMFSHEFGIFLMQDAIMPLFNEMKDYCNGLDSPVDLTYVPWSAYESLSCWYNCKIAGHETLDYMNFGEADAETFCKIYNKLSEAGLSDPAELYVAAVKQYISQL